MASPASGSNSTSSPPSPPDPPPPPALTPPKRCPDWRKSPAFVQSQSRAPPKSFVQQVRDGAACAGVSVHADGEQCLLVISSKDVEMTVLQEGPQCGMVALAMAAHAFGNTDLSAAKVQSVAAERGYSRHGELFSADWMQTLASDLIDVCEASVLDCRALCTDVALQAGEFARKRSVFLVPYDSDSNHFPGVRGGQHAHWGLVIGLAIVANKDQLPSLPMRQSQECPEVYEVHLPLTPEEAETIQDLLSLRQSLFLVRQSKSPRLFLFEPSALLKSNLQLEACTKEDDSLKDFVLPTGGVKAGLAAKAVVIWKPKQAL